MDKSNNHFFALIIDNEGNIITKIVCPPIFCDTQPPKFNIKDFFNKRYYNDLDSFLSDIYHSSKPIIKTMIIDYLETEKEINLIGANINDGFLIIGNESTECVDYRVFEEMMMINNEQANHIRKVTQNNHHLKKCIKPDQEKLYEQFTKTNNELVNAQRQLTKKNAELERALNQIDLLSRMIPICSNCKKIRDDSGFWEQLESYLSRHSKMVFSHGICPECMEKLYPEFVKKIKKQSTDDKTP